MSIFNMPSVIATSYDPLSSIDDSMTTKEMIYSLPEDIIVMSCTLHRLHTELKTDPSTTLLDECLCWSLSQNANQIIEYITPSDREKAIIVRNHFSQKLIQYSLMVGPLTSFKASMNMLLTTDFTDISASATYKVPDKLIGIAYKLPEFYEYDIAQMSLFTDVHKLVIGPERCEVESLEVKFLSKLTTGRRKDRINIEYWFEDENKNRVLTNVARGNPLIPLLDKAVESRNLNLTASLIKRENYTVEYYVASRWSLAE